MARTLDLDRLDPATLDGLGLPALEKIVASFGRLQAVRKADPELRQTILRRIREAVALGRITEAQAATIRAELESSHPGVVLEGHADKILDLDKPTIGHYRRAFPRREQPMACTAVELLAADPRRLGGVVREMARFSSDWKAIAGAVAELADAAGIDEEMADEIIAEALQKARGEGRHG